MGLVLYVLGMWTITPRLYIARAQTEYGSFGRSAAYLRDHCTPGDKVMIEPIGIVGFQAPVRIVDEVGLVSPRVAERRLLGPGWYSDIAEAERPEWLVIRLAVLKSGNAFAGTGDPFRNGAERDSLMARYRVEDSGDSRAGDQAMVVLHRLR